MALDRFKLACIQLFVTSNKTANLTRAKTHIQTAVKHGAQVVKVLVGKHS